MCDLFQVCRYFATHFSTPRKKGISFQSFKNHFDQPDQSLLAQTGVILGKWMKNVEKLQYPGNDI